MGLIQSSQRSNARLSRSAGPWLCAALVAPFAGGCAATKMAAPAAHIAATAAASATAPQGEVQHVEMDAVEVRVVEENGKRRVEAVDAGDLFEQAGADLAAERWDAAVAGYDRLIEKWPASRYTMAGLYNAGLALEGKKDYAGAVQRYRALIERYGGPITSTDGGKKVPRDVLDALFRMGACLAETSNWAASAEAFARLLENDGLSTIDRIEGLTRRGLAQYNLKDFGTAERTFRQAITVYRDAQADERIDDGFFVAMSQFYLAELSHMQFRALPIRLPERQLKKDLDAKAQALLVTQARYVDVARVRNVVWATAAGFQMGTLYKELYDALMDAPVPPELGSDGKQVYLDELRKEIQPLIRKAIHAHELTQQVARSNGVDNDWVRKSNEQMDQLRALLDPESASTPPVDPKRATTPVPTPADKTPGQTEVPARPAPAPADDQSPTPSSRTRPPEREELPPRAIF